MTSNRMEYMTIHDFLPQCSMLFRVVCSVLVQMLASKTANALDYGKQLNFGEIRF